MITFSDQVFALETDQTSYLFRITPHGHLEHIHYGERVPLGEVETLSLKRAIMHGSSVSYSQQDSAYCLDNLPLEWSEIGRAHL